jgi:hypothetical protein
MGSIDRQTAVPTGPGKKNAVIPIKIKKKGWEHCSSGTAPAYQGQDPKFKPQYTQKEKKSILYILCFHKFS